MAPDDLRKRLVEINRRRWESAPPAAPPPPRGSFPLLPDLAPGRGGDHLRIDFDAKDLDGLGRDLIGRHTALLPFDGDLSGSRPALERFARDDPAATVYLDIETAGLASAAPVFLVGLLRREGGAFRIRQYFARDYGEEGPLLRALAADLAGFRGIVTFNGKSFDVPYMRDRATLAHVDLAAPPEHLDLLHEARRHLRSTLPDCRLQTIEAALCGRRRAGDIPGAEIAPAYHGFVRTGDPSLMRLVFRHNALDLIALAEIAIAVVEFASGQRRPLRRP